MTFLTFHIEAFTFVSSSFRSFRNIRNYCSVLYSQFRSFKFVSEDSQKIRSLGLTLQSSPMALRRSRYLVSPSAKSIILRANLPSVDCSEAVARPITEVTGPSRLIEREMNPTCKKLCVGRQTNC
ncbi:hypothetical protein MARPO_0010s0122 [Marchantia polymorpha]|uniref:Uncharacterized protein n=1 Tax=Marchantia polymorpha TaxID=3197 RepID=A0A2R6XKX5_MARPO|nr:hypothetical protein MARPO_0010s0122 [Marchantia polymorpha]PTQ46732.1 hypothetical protein MARPO_0010s0122 [Marchantia polymorpha]|eukprot:PTQ46731.1 hypothetical protein MARPO_0010s0122 [Marchantia polymorpha]